MVVSPPSSSPARTYRSQYQSESLRTPPYPSGLRTFPRRTSPAKRETKRAPLALLLGTGILLCHPVTTKPPAPPRASPRLDPLLSQPFHRPPHVSDISIRSRHPAYPLTGWGGYRSPPRYSTRARSYPTTAYMFNRRLDSRSTYSHA